jgi:hypothetical protein
MGTPQRNRLDAHTKLIGICQVLRPWLRAGIIDELHAIFVSKEDEAIQKPVDVELDIILEDLKEGENGCEWPDESYIPNRGLGATSVTLGSHSLTSHFYFHPFHPLHGEVKWIHSIHSTEMS